MKQDKNSGELEDFIIKIIPTIPGVVTKKMFGHPAAFVNDYMFVRVHPWPIILKLSESDRDDFLKLKSIMLFEGTLEKYEKSM